MNSDILKKINIAILDDQKMLSGLLKKNFEHYDFIGSIEIFDKLEFFFKYLKNNNIDILIVDSVVDKIGFIEILNELRMTGFNKETEIILLSASLDQRLIKNAVSSAIKGIVSKEDEIDEIINALKSIFLNNEKLYFSFIVKNILLYSKNNEAEENIIKLSPRENQLLKLICNCKTAKEMAFELDLSINTIYFYTKRLMSKMNVNRTPDLILKAINDGFVINNKYDSKIDRLN